MKVLLLFILLFNVQPEVRKSLFQENFIGLSEMEVKQLINSEFNSFKLNTSFVNKEFDYLKFENNISEITILYFFKGKEGCSVMRMMCDYRNINDILAQMDQFYIKDDRNSWHYEKDKKEYTVKLEEEDWFFTVTIKEKD